MRTVRAADVDAAWRHADEAECTHVSRVLEIVGQRWSPSILLTMARGAERFSDVLGGVAGLSARMLAVRLKQLETAGLVERTVVPTTPVTVRYRLTARGVDLLAAIRPIADHVRRWESEPDQAQAARG